ncbi:MAG: hypothetical protein CSA35_01490 [Dethiosulfovibrio peptidovorans]|nr:MAG: hypothetical protein CSA35_01490 [Dethiosulfovibrio peptidovorans]
MARILEGFEKENPGVMVNTVNLMENMDYGKKYKVRVVPTLVFLSPEGEMLHRQEGVMTAEQLQDKWMELGYDISESKN